MNTVHKTALETGSNITDSMSIAILPGSHPGVQGCEAQSYPFSLKGTLRSSMAGGMIRNP